MSLSGVEDTTTLAYSRDPGSVGITTGDRGVEKSGKAENRGKQSFDGADIDWNLLVSGLWKKVEDPHSQPRVSQEVR